MRIAPLALLFAATACTAHGVSADATPSPHPASASVASSAPVESGVSAGTAGSIVDLRIPDTDAGPEGLEAVLVEPSGGGRHPLVLVSHGSPRDAAGRPAMRARDQMPQLQEFAKRGYVAAAVLRRGYGSSGGGWAESFGTCDDANFTDAGLASAADLTTAIDVLSKRGDVDATKIVAVGVSAGGFATVALTADPPAGLVAAISFAGGRGSSGPDAVCDEDALADAFATYGKTSRVPMLWVYAANDHFFGPALAQRLRTSFEAGGGLVSFQAEPAYGDEGHALFSAAGIPRWTPLVERFLARQHLPSTVVAVEPMASLAPPEGLSEAGDADFVRFLAGADHRAFAVSERGGYAWRTNRSSAAEAQRDALASCEATSRETCTTYAIDEALVATP